jgi:glycerol-3-phosphate dehydrogenase (NAD(P)+)
MPKKKEGKLSRFAPDWQSKQQDAEPLQICILGGGAFGTALALSASEKNRVCVWEYDPARVEQVRTTRMNPLALEGIRLPESIGFTTDMGEALEGADLVIFAIPSHFMRRTAEQAVPHILPKTIIATVAKGIEENTDLRMTQILKHFFKKHPILAISGPTHAEEIAQRLPTTLIIAGKRKEVCQRVQYALMTPYLRIYTNKDVLGVELAGALKNIIAIGCGMSDGIGFGDNAKSALMTRGLAEMIRFGKKMGAKAKTFHGLAGIGDLITTCYSKYGRNLFVGRQLGMGKKLDDILAGMTQVAEGVRTTHAVHEIAKKEDIEMPITSQMYAVMFEGRPIKEAVSGLMERSAKSEDYDYSKDAI